ncbi:hypothetical protein GCM10010924_12090 [Rhizobium wenxiniae]|nr:hypothetical protein GCM10010924_12090 [Rhizobium wenxiniae]
MGGKIIDLTKNQKQHRGRRNYYTKPQSHERYNCVGQYYSRDRSEQQRLDRIEIDDPVNPRREK